MSDPLLPLAGLSVLDLTEGVAGPAASQMLGDLGAAVVKVERPQGDWGRFMGAASSPGGGPNFQALNRNKRDICLDLRRPRAIEVAHRLLERTDVVVASYRPGVLERLGLGFDDVHARHPEVVYARISAFGYDGALAAKPGSDTALQAVSGLMSQIGEPDGPPGRIGIPALDVVASRDAVIGILAALAARGAGHVLDHPVDISLFGSAAALQTQVWQQFFDGGTPQRRTGHRNPGIAPAGTYRTKDDRYLAVAVLREEHWRNICAALGLDDLVDDPRFATNAERLDHREELEAIVEPIFAGNTLEDWVRVLSEHDIIAAPVMEIPEIAADPDLMAAVPVVALPDGVLRGRVRTIGLPFSLGDDPGREATAPPAMGEHTREVLAELGYDAADITELLATGVCRG